MKRWGLCAAALVFLLAACGVRFDGSRIGNDSGLVMDYRMFNKTDSQDLTAAAGDVIRMKLVVKGGSLSVKLQRAGAAPIYENSQISASEEVDVPIEEDGTYTVTVTGRRARGSVSFTVEPPS